MDYKWAFEPLFDGLEHGREILLLARLSVRGVYSLEEKYEHLQQFAELKELVVYGEEPLKSAVKSYSLGTNRYLRLTQQDLETELEHAEEAAKAAREERDRNYRGLNNQAFVSAWGMLEDTIRVFLVRWMANRKDARSAATKELGNVRLAEYDRLDEEEKLFFIVEQLFLRRLGKGANRFENLLRVFDLSGPVDENREPYVGDGELYGRERALREGHLLRDVLMHRRGIVDAKTKRECPSLAHEVGDHIHFTEMGLLGLVMPMLEYIGLVIERVADNVGRSAPSSTWTTSSRRTGR